MKKIAKNLCLISSLFLLTSCEKPEITELKRLCALDAGQKVYETVQADGYFDAGEDGRFVHLKLLKGPSMSLDKGAYEFIEFCSEKITIVGYGCWRAKKVLRKNGQCNANIDALLNKKTSHRYVEFIKDKCIAVEEIDKQEAKYRFDWNTKEWNDNSSGFKFIRGDQYITDVTSNKVIARNITYGAVKNNAHYNCGSPQITGVTHKAGKDLISITIKPIAK